MGQGCSGISNKPHFISFRIPTLESPEIKELNEVKITSKTDKIPQNELYRKQVMRESQKPVVAARKVYNGKLKAINKEIKIQDTPEFKVQKVAELTHKTVKSDERVLSLRMHIKHTGFNVTPLEPISIVQAYKGYLEDMSNRLAQIESKREHGLQATKTKQVVASYDPTSKEAIAKFEENQLNDIVDAVTQAKEDIGDDIVFMDYSRKEKKKQHIASLSVMEQDESVDDEVEVHESKEDRSLTKVASSDISHRVTNVIKREMGAEGNSEKPQNSYAELLKQFNKQGPISQIMAAPNRDEQRSKMIIHAFHTEFGKGLGEAVHNFAMYSAADNNKVYEDYNEGKINYEYSLNGYSGILRATLVKNFYVRTTIEAPLNGEYSNMEVPLIDVKSFEDYMDRNNLSGYGGNYLVDLGEYFEDVEISSDQNKQASYEQRVYLDEDFKIVKSGRDYRYIFFLGVIPGNIRVQYLGANREETSKITFVAPDEITFDFAKARPSHEVGFNLTLKNTLGVQNVPLDLDIQKMITFVGQKTPTKVSAGKYNLNIPWGLRGGRTYLEVNHLSSPIFVGMDGNRNLELPSIEFVHEILRSFEIDELHNNECLVHINFAAKEVVDVKVRGESALGPMTYEQSYLDKDGVFTKYVSPMSNKVFLLGNEEGIFSIQINYADGKKDYLRTYCSPGTYLLEQL